MCDSRLKKDKEEDKGESREQLKILYYWPMGVWKSVCMWGCVHVVMSLGPVYEAQNHASSDVTRMRRWWWWRLFLRGIKSTQLPDIILHLRLLTRLRVRQVTRQSTHITQLSIHTSLHFTDMHLLTGLYLNYMSFHWLQQLFLIAWRKDEQMLETVRAEQCTAQSGGKRSCKDQVSFLENDL